jgi:hypothetical protein
MIAAFGAFQSWDGIFSFDYAGNTDFEPRKIPGFFDIKANTPRLAHMPACAAMFLRGDVAAARSAVSVAVSLQTERQKLYESLTAAKLAATDFGLDGRLSLLHGMALDLGKGQSGAAASNATPLGKDLSEFVSDTGELRWDVRQQGAGYFTVDTPHTKLFTGFVRGRTFELGKVLLKIGATRADWATVSLVAIDGDAFDKPGRVLIAATGLVQNQGAKLASLAGDNVTLGNQWGNEPVLCEGIPAEVILPVTPQRVRFYPLDESGNRRAEAAAGELDGKTLLQLDPKHKTIWYEVEIK